MCSNVAHTQHVGCVCQTDKQAGLLIEEVITEPHLVNIK